MVTQPKTKSLRDLITRFFDAKRHLAPGTLEFYHTMLGNFEWYCRSHHWLDPSLLTIDHLRDFIHYVATETYRWPEAPRAWYKKASPSTVHHYGLVIKTLFNWAEDEGYLDDNPSRRLKIGGPRYKDVHPYTDEEVRAMLQVCDDDARFRFRYLGLRNKAIISLFIDTGLRLAELSQIGVSQLEPRLRQVQIMGKGGRPRVVPINGQARKALRHYLELRPQGGDELWKTSDGSPLSPYSVQILIARLKKRAGVSSEGGPHRFRHYFATKYLEAGGDLNSLRLLLGHSTLEMVLKYSKYVDVGRALAQHEQFSPLDRLYQGGNHRGGWGWRG